MTQDELNKKAASLSQENGGCKVVCVEHLSSDGDKKHLFFRREKNSLHFYNEYFLPARKENTESSNVCVRFIKTYLLVPIAKDRDKEIEAVLEDLNIIHCVNNLILNLAAALYSSQKKITIS